MSLFSFLKPDTLPAADFLERVTDDDLILDVRTPDEFAEGHMVGAQNIDVMAPDFKKRVAELDTSKTAYLYCRSGNRSGNAATILKGMGFEEAHNVGGLSDLARAGAPLER